MHDIRRLAALLVVVTVVAACGQDDAAPTTTTVPDTTTIATTTTTEGRRQFEMNGTPFIRLGDRGAYVEALQWYLVCSGFDRYAEDAPEMTIDGVYGQMTGTAVAYAQAIYGRVPIGEPDEETFALLARDCDEDRVVTIPISGGEVEVAGNAAPGDDDIIRFEGGAGRVVEVVITDGNVSVALEQPGGGVLRTITPGGGWSARLTETGTYTLRATADDSQSYRARLRVGG
jgi:peptidoglycan hydrolase-like protein with peptidoglycan-binding domain